MTAGTRPRVGAGLSTHEDGREAARVAIDAALAPLAGEPADLVLLFVSPQHEDAQRAIIDIATPLGIAVHDHIIVGKSGHTSLKGLRLV